MTVVHRGDAPLCAPMADGVEPPLEEDLCVRQGDSGV